MPNNSSSIAKVKTKAGDSPVFSDMIEGVRRICQYKNVYDIQTSSKYNFEANGLNNNRCWGVVLIS